MGASWATKCAYQVDQSDLASLAPKVRVIQYPISCHPKLIKVVLCSSRLRHNAWTTSASSALSHGFCWNFLNSLSQILFFKKGRFSFIFYVRWLTKMLFQYSSFWSRILYVFTKVNLWVTFTRDFHAIHNYQARALRALGLLLYSRIWQWEGERLFDRSAWFFYGNSCNSGTESQKIVGN